MIQATQLTEIYLVAQSNFDTVIRAQKPEHRLATIGFMACETCLMLSEDLTRAVFEVVEAMTGVFQSLANETSGDVTEHGQLMHRMFLRCESATHDLAHLCRSMSLNDG